MEKVCLFFASDYHFEMISLPYINKELKENKNVMIITENDLENTIKKLLNNINMEQEEKEKIMHLNWNNDDVNKLDEIKEIKNQETTLFIKGNKSYIDNINQNINKWSIGEKLKIINCYDINEVKNNINNIVNGYNKILNTAGEEVI